MNVHFSSARFDVPTPRRIYEALDAEFHFQSDPCPFLRPSHWDGLRDPWEGRAFVNPPYGRKIPLWIAKGFGEVHNGHCELVVFLIPSRTDTNWWHDYVMHPTNEIRFIRGRIKFGGYHNDAPFPSCIVVMRHDH